MTSFPETTAAVAEWETKTFFPTVIPAKLATVISELTAAMTVSSKKIEKMEVELRTLRRQVGMSHRHEVERGVYEAAVDKWQCEQQARINAERDQIEYTI